MKLNPASKLVLFFFASTQVLASLTYYVLSLIRPDGYVFGVYYRMIMYHKAHPLQYIAVVAVTYALVATPFALMFARLAGWKRSVLIVGIMLFSVWLASFPGGFLYGLHHMRPSSLHQVFYRWRELMGEVRLGGELGVYIIAGSTPFNVIGLILGFFVTRRGFQMAGHARQEMKDR